ncbi:MAG TPA: hypothetical protein VLJ42_01740 [Solirubrobacteraceae bacterium]|nr:hypothetical protein [Solirubrobacteraceae bacterium]
MLGLALAGLALLLAGLALSACGSSDRASTKPALPPAHAPSAARQPPFVKDARGGLAIGLSEANANLLLALTTPVPAGFEPARAALTTLHPAYVRVAVDWAAVQPSAGAPAAFDTPTSGCARQTGPCATYAGLRAELHAIATQQRSGRGFQPLVVIFDAPRWAAVAPSGCLHAGVSAGARLINARGLDGYRQLVLSLLALGRRERVALNLWSPWDEPNQPLFISPQRTHCAKTAPLVSPAIYTKLARTLAVTLRNAGSDHQLVLGDLADFPKPRAQVGGIGEFVAALPQDVICSARIWAQHEYPKPGAPHGVPGGVRALERALDARGACGARARIWVTETGVGAPRSGQPRDLTPAGLAAECRLMSQVLSSWYRDTRVDAAFQYSFREDPSFQVGLADAALTRLYPVYHLFEAWAGMRKPSGAPAPLPPACS